MSVSYDIMIGLSIFTALIVQLYADYLNVYMIEDLKREHEGVSKISRWITEFITSATTILSVC